MTEEILDNNDTLKPLPKRGLRGLFSLLTNKYLLSGVFFVVWMFWFDPKDIRTDIARYKRFKALEQSEQQLTNQIAETQFELDQLKTNALTIEKYAREKYYMKKDNEDLFVVPEKTSNK